MTTYTLTEAQRQQLLDVSLAGVSKANTLASKLLQSLAPSTSLPPCTLCGAKEDQCFLQTSTRINCKMAAPSTSQPLTGEQREWIVATCPTPAHIIDAVEAALKAAPSTSPEPAVDDALQGAVDWFLQADGEFFCVATVQRTLRIGYNRAKHLCDIAKERAAIKGGA